MSDYIMDLRKIVGHRPLLQAAASIIIENENGQVLLGRRTDNHQWGYSGGSIELGRKYHGNIKRQEEEMEVLEFFDVDDIPEDISDPIRPVVRRYIKMRKGL